LKQRGTGTIIIKTKLAQQLAHLDQAPFYWVFTNLKKNYKQQPGSPMNRIHCRTVVVSNPKHPARINRRANQNHQYFTLNHPYVTNVNLTSSKL
jgi:hypothetical protein